MMFNDYVDKTLVVNLDRHSARRRHAEHEFAKAGIHYEFFKAVDGMEINVDQLVECRLENKKLKRGEIGCFLSHYRIWALMLKRGWKRLAVFEDDAEFPEDFCLKWETCMEQLVDIEYDFCYLGCCCLEPQNHCELVPTTIGKAYQTHAYILTFQGASILLDSLKIIKDPVDVQLSSLKGLGKIGFVPNLVDGHRMGCSTQEN